ncbi:MAG: ATP phosphoribosyltransferase [Candidatus Diapherotrites archaeon]|nr:ATP phosphoribosyltransferase [Candidatus Diapherotrites archaeon]
MKIRLGIPKGRLFEKVKKVLDDAGINIGFNGRNYRPLVRDSEIEVKLFKAQNIPKLVELGLLDAGFTGYDWVVEQNSKVVELLDLGFGKVDLVVAIPEQADWNELKKKKIVVVSEFENLAKKFLEQQKVDFVFMKSFGATEVFPPEDADLIVDLTETGQTLKENNLKIVEVLLSSSARLVANKNSLQDSFKNAKLQEIKLLIQSVLNAKERVLLEMNVPKNKFQDVVPFLPCMKSPTVSELFGDQGYVVKIAVKKSETAKLIPLLKSKGVTDILEFNLAKVVP